MDDLDTRSWLQSKCQAQRKALHVMNRRIVAQRAVLRRLTELGFVLTSDQWADLRADRKDLSDDDMELVGT